MRKIFFFLVLLTFYSRGFPGIFDILSEEMKEHVAYLRMLPVKIQTIILQQWFTKGMLYTPQRVRTISAHNYVDSVVWNPNGATLTSASGNEGTIKVWQRNGTLAQTLSHHLRGVTSLAWNPAGTLLASGTWIENPAICLWTLDGTVWKTLLGRANLVPLLAWNYDGSVLASSDRLEIELWKSDGTLVQTLSGHTSIVRSIAWSPDGIILVSGSDDGIINLWDTHDGTLVQTLSGHRGSVSSLAWIPNGSILASASYDATIRLWTAEGVLMRILTLGDINCINSLSWNPDGTLLAAGHSDGTIRLWKADGILVQTLSGHTSQVNSLSWSPDGTVLASGSNDGTIRFWNFSQPPLLDPQEWNNLTLEQALLLRFLYATPRHAVQMLLPERSEYRKSDIHQALNVFSPATRQRLIDRYYLLQTLLTGNPMSNSL